ncbi:hypothetical protein [Dactylosporangium darangshiense]
MIATVASCKLPAAARPAACPTLDGMRKSLVAAAALAVTGS